MSADARGEGIPAGGRLPQFIRVSRAGPRAPSRAQPVYLLYGFLVLIAAGTVLLWLPVSSRDDGSAPLLTALFTSTSAVCVTGLVVVDTRDYWSPFGQAVILALIHLGGLGFMTSSTLLFMLVGRRLSMRQRLLAGQTLGRLSTADVRRLIGRIVVMTLAIEATGTALLVMLAARDGLSGFEVWRSVFTAISAFNNAGMDLEGGFRSLVDSREQTAFVAVLMALVALGGLGYAVIADVATRRSWARLAVDSKLVIATSATLWAGGAVVFLLLERAWEGGLDVADVSDAGAMSVFARTAGFTTVNLAGLEQATLFMLSGLMFIGGASASTAGGIKLSTFSALFVTIVAALRGRERVTVFEREIPTRQIYRALSVALLSVAIVFMLAFALAVMHAGPFLDLYFEAVSAFGTVGLSVGVTPEVPAGAQMALVAGMYIGRLGPLTIALALMQRSDPEQLRYPTEEINVG